MSEPEPSGLSPLARRLIEALVAQRGGALPVRSLDAGLAARLVRLVGTPLYGLRERASSVDDALAFLGLDTVLRLALAIELADSFSLPAHDVERGALRRTWLMQAVAARRLAVETRAWNAEEALLAGLLADCGVLDLLQRLPAYRDLLVRYYAGNGELVALEREAFGEDHATATLRRITRWGVPEGISNAVRSRWNDGAGAPHAGRILAAAALLAQVHTVAGLASSAERVERRVGELLDLTPGLVASIAAGLPGELRQVIDALEREPVSRSQAQDAETWPDPSEVQVEVDEETGLIARDGFEHLLDVFHDRAVQLHRPLALLVVELESLKDGASAPARGLLVDLAQRIARLVRRTDPHARIAEAQVAILAPGCAAGDAPLIAERIRVGLERGGPAPDGGPPQVLIGMAAAAPHHDGSDAGSLLASAYTALSRQQN